MATLAMIALGSVLLHSSAGLADNIVTDANVVTGLDISDSIAPEDMRLEIEGMAQAVRSAEFLAAIQSGSNGRIGFAVFAWHHNQFPLVVSWTLIVSEQDALGVARQIEARLRVDVEVEARNSETFYAGRLTDLSQAIDHATEMLQAAPYAARRSVANIIGNGEDNVGEDAAFARDRSIEKGVVVNGVVLGGDPAMLDYYRRQVVGGPGAFVMSTSSSATMAEVLVRKFLYDIVMNTGLIPGGPALARQ
jgi:hypothetical protein